MTNLVKLSLSENEIQNIDALKNLVNLKDLDLEENIIKDISALENLNSLVYLDISENQIEDLSALSSISTLEELKCSENRLYDFSPLENINLKKLESEDNVAYIETELGTTEFLNLIRDKNNSMIEIIEKDGFINNFPYFKYQSKLELQLPASVYFEKELDTEYYDEEISGKLILFNSSESEFVKKVKLMDGDDLIFEFDFGDIFDDDFFDDDFFEDAFEDLFDDDDLDDDVDDDKDDDVDDDKDDDLDDDVDDKDDVDDEYEEFLEEYFDYIFDTDYLKEPYKRSYVFAGWEQDGKIVKKVKINDENTVLKATWKKLPVFDKEKQADENASASITDVIMLLQYVSKIGPMYDYDEYDYLYPEENADLNFDGKLDIADVIIMLKNM
ncbi:MAG: hypothetical protein GX362_06150 [Methanosarcinaceae archaeon]|nr:hypothetical protein [Methanosarcinaceae archaeon]